MIQKNSNKGKLFIVGTPIGNLEDITLRALRILKEVNFIAAEDTRQLQKILNKYQIKNRSISYHEHNKVTQGPRIILELLKGKSGALVSDAGTPGISDPGYRLIQLAIDEGIEVIPIPGPSAVISSLSVSGLPTDSFFFCGFLPAKKGERRKKLEVLKDYPSTLIFYEAPHRLVKSLKDIYEVFGNRKIVIARELTKIYEEIIRGELKDVLLELPNKKLKGEVTLLIEGRGINRSNKEIPLNLTQKFEELLQNGFSNKEAMKQLAQSYGVSKSKIYRQLLKNKKN